MTRSLSERDIALLVERVDQAQRQARAIPKLTEDFPSMNIADGYAVQHQLRRRRIERGERLIGWKAGLTSRAKMNQMGIDVPSIGFLTSSMAWPQGQAMPTDRMLHPRVECEIAFVMKQALSGARCTREEVLSATDFVLPALEIIDSRFSGFKFDLPSVIADNASAARLVIGGCPCDPLKLDLRTIGVVLEKNGEIVATAAAAAVLGHPADAVAMLVGILAQFGEELPAGSLVMSGGITEAVAVRAGDSVIARFQHLGSISTKFS